MPHLLTRLAQESLGGQPVQRLERPIKQRQHRHRPQLGVLGRDPRGQNPVDPFVVTSPASDDERVGEVRVADHGQQGLRQVVVDVRVDPQQHVPQGGERRRCVEGQPPRTRHVGTACEVEVERCQVEVGEHHVPAFDPVRVLELRVRDGLADGEGRPAVRLQEEPLGSPFGRYPDESIVHGSNDCGDVAISHPAPFHGGPARLVSNAGPAVVSGCDRHLPTREPGVPC